MKVGVKVNAPIGPVTWRSIQDMAIAADEAGLDSVWSEDHHFEPYGGPWDVWAILSALAAVTRRVALAPIVASTNYHPSPVLLARRALAVHEISGGRVILGLGAGSAPFEYAKLGLPFDHPVSRFEEAFEIVRRLLAGERFDYDGTFHQLEDTWLSPVHRHRDGPKRDSDTDPWLDEDWRSQPTEPAEIPLMAGSLGPRMLGIILPYVAGWNVHWSNRRFWNRPENFPDAAAWVAEHADRAGRQPGEIWSSAEIYMQFPDHHGLPVDVPDDLEALPADAEVLQRCREAGIDHLIVLPDPQTPESVERLADLVRSVDE